MIGRRTREGTLVVQTAYLGNVVLTTWRAATLAVAARVPERTGFAGSSASRLYTARVDRPLHGHETARLAALAGVPVGDTLPAVCLGLGAADRAAAGAWLADHGVSGDFLALAPSSAWGARRWPYYPAAAALASIMQSEETRRALRAGH